MLPEPLAPCHRRSDHWPPETHHWLQNQPRCRSDSVNLAFPRSHKVNQFWYKQRSQKNPLLERLSLSSRVLPPPALEAPEHTKSRVDPHVATVLWRRQPGGDQNPRRSRTTHQMNALAPTALRELRPLGSPLLCQSEQMTRCAQEQSPLRPCEQISPQTNRVPHSNAGISRCDNPQALSRRRHLSSAGNTGDTQPD